MHPYGDTGPSVGPFPTNLSTSDRGMPPGMHLGEFAPMKNMFLGLAIACMTVACASEKKASVEDSAAPGAVECATEECATKCETEKSECSSEAKAECSSKQVCPVTGKEIN